LMSARRPPSGFGGYPVPQQTPGICRCPVTYLPHNAVYVLE
jgi:hypothetical protein